MKISVNLEPLKAQMSKKNSRLMASTIRGKGVTFPEREVISENKGERKVFYPSTNIIHTEVFSSDKSPKPDRIVAKNYIRGGYRFSEERKKNISCERRLKPGPNYSEFVFSFNMEDKLLTYLMKKTTHV